jgi:hypothetical protein
MPRTNASWIIAIIAVSDERLGAGSPGFERPERIPDGLSAARAGSVDPGKRAEDARKTQTGPDAAASP